MIHSSADWWNPALDAKKKNASRLDTRYLFKGACVSMPEMADSGEDHGYA